MISGSLVHASERDFATKAVEPFAEEITQPWFGGASRGLGCGSSAHAPTHLMPTACRQ